MENPFEDIIWLHDMVWGEQNFIDLGHDKFLSVLLEHGYHVRDPLSGRITTMREPQYVKLNCALQTRGENLEFVEFDELDEFSYPPGHLEGDQAELSRMPPVHAGC